MFQFVHLSERKRKHQTFLKKDLTNFVLLYALDLLLARL